MSKAPIPLETALEPAEMRTLMTALTDETFTENHRFHNLRDKHQACIQELAQLQQRIEEVTVALTRTERQMFVLAREKGF